VSRWREIYLGDLGRIVTGKTPSTSVPDYFGGDVPFVTPSDMFGHKVISRTERCLTKAGVTAVKGSFIPKGSVMVSCIGSDMGKVTIAAHDCVSNQQINSILVSEEFSADFVYYNLSTRKAELQSMACSGSAQPILNKGHFSELPIVVPPLPEQRAIAAVLGSLDDKIELNRRMNETLEALAQSLFKSRFVDATQSALPKGWRETNLEDAIVIHDSKRIPLSSRERALRRGKYPYHGAASVMDYVDDYLFDGVYALMGEDGSVVNDDNTPILQYVWGKFWVNNHAHVLTGKNGVSVEHLLLFLKTVNIRPFVTGAVQPKLNQGNLCRVPFVLPPESVSKEFAGIIEPMFARIRANHEESRTLAALRDALLPKLLSGELRVPAAAKLMEACA